ncbi:CD109 [Mytilus coruscus]|uniref:CD109 n=1 Tax=Mytilus coruscus TaxID=42192 RepID=A0A6J8DGR9_MYTCO|nr:CD109 [Mytilus coruscus]
MRLVLCLLLAFVGLVLAKNTYIATVPKQIRAGSSARICLSALKRSDRQVTIFVTILDKQNGTIATAQAQRNLRRGYGVVNIKVPGNTTARSDYKIRVSVIGDITFDQTAIRIQVSSKVSSIFIQTDKAVYKPGDLVQFRVFGTNTRLKVLRNPLTNLYTGSQKKQSKTISECSPSVRCICRDISIIFLDKSGTLDSQSGAKDIITANRCPVEISPANRCLVEISPANGCPVEISPANGCPVEISPTNGCPVEISPTNGYRAEISPANGILPKFEVNVVLPSFELKTDRFFTVTINALYTFGKPVQGDAELTIKRRWTRNTKDQIVKKFKINGKATIRVLMSEIEPRLGTYIEVIAKVTETITGISANDTVNVQIYDTPEKLTFSSSMSSFFKPGLDYTIILRATQRDDSPLNPPLGFVNITVTYTVPGERKPQNGLPSPGGNQIMPLPFPQPINTDTNVLWTRLEQIPES